MILRFGAVLLALALPGCAATASAPARHAHTANLPDAAPYNPDANAEADLQYALGQAEAQSRRVLLIFGANWCHDSRTLTGWLATERFRALTDEYYEIVYIEAGTPQTGQGHNLELAAEFGVADITGTPTVLVLDSEGHLLNTAKDARSWRNAASRDPDDIYGWLEQWTGTLNP